MKSKKFVAGLLALVTVFSFGSVSTGAQKEVQTIVYHAIDGKEVPAERGVEPRFKYFNNITCHLSEENGISTATGTASVNTSYSNTLTVATERKKNGSWSSMKTRSNDDSSSFLVVEYDYALTRGYSYRALSTIVVDTGAHTEIATCESSILYY